jgi:hypothetical protein
MWGRAPSACPGAHIHASGPSTCTQARLIGPQRDDRLRIQSARLHQREPSHAATTPFPQRPWSVAMLQPATGLSMHHSPSSVILLAWAPELSLLFTCCRPALSSRLAVVHAYSCLSPHIPEFERLSAPTAFELGPVEKVGAYH